LSSKIKYLFEYTDLRRHNNWEQNNEVMQPFEEEMSYYFNSLILCCTWLMRMAWHLLYHILFLFLFSFFSQSIKQIQKQIGNEKKNSIDWYKLFSALTRRLQDFFFTSWEWRKILPTMKIMRLLLWMFVYLFFCRIYFLLLSLHLNKNWNEQYKKKNLREWNV